MDWIYTELANYDLKSSCEFLGQLPFCGQTNKKIDEWNCQTSTEHGKQLVLQLYLKLLNGLLIF